MSADASAMLAGWQCSKHELAVRVERYAASIGKPVNEVMLSLLHSAVDDLGDVSAECNRLRWSLDDLPRYIECMLRRKGMTRRELCEKAGISAPTLVCILHHGRSPRVSTAARIVGALESE